MRLNVRKRNGVWAVAVDDAVIQWYPNAAFGIYAWDLAMGYVDLIKNSRSTQIQIERELGLRN